MVGDLYLYETKMVKYLQKFSVNEVILFQAYSLFCTGWQLKFETWGDAPRLRRERLSALFFLSEK